MRRVLRKRRGGVGDLSRILKVRVRSTRTVDADIPGESDMRAAMRLGHHGYNCDL